MKNILFIDKSVKGQVTDSISKNFNDSDLEPGVIGSVQSTILFLSGSTLRKMVCSTKI